MFRAFLPAGLALAAASLLPLSASAVPIKAADGVPTSAPSRQSGPRHPGLIPTPMLEASLDGATVSPNRRGRPVPSQSKTLNAADSQRSRVAEGVPSRAPSQL